MLIVCNGMLRSGSTLQYNLVRTLLVKGSAGQAQGYFTAKQLEQQRPNFEQWASDGKLHVVKTHDVCAWLLEDPRVKVLYTYRDLRDVAASIKRKWPSMDLFDALAQAIDAFAVIVASPRVLSQRYEDLTRDPLTAAAAIAGHLGLSPSRELLEEAVRENSVERASAAAARVAGQRSGKLLRVLRFFGFRPSIYDRESLLHDDHISSTAGAIGVWREILTSKEQREIESRFGSWLRQQGYSV